MEVEDGFDFDENLTLASNYSLELSRMEKENSNYSMMEKVESYSYDTSVRIVVLSVLLALALVEIWVTSARARREAELSLLAEEAGVAAPKLLSQQRKLALVRLELVKFVSDVGKAIFDCELYFAHEGVFIGCALFSGILSTHKNMFKILK